MISIDWDESGFTRTRGGNFPAIICSGYLGSILFGSIMLRTAIVGRYEKICAISTGMIILLFPLIIPRMLSHAVIIMGIFWGLVFIISGLLSSFATRMLLFLMGGLTSLYSVYDLNDFFHGDISHTDAGIIASHYMRNPDAALILSYIIGIMISVLSIWILYRIVYNALHESSEVETPGTAEAEPDIRQLELVSSLAPETIEMIVKMHGQKKEDP
jgi:hypothetical protein